MTAGRFALFSVLWLLVFGVVAYVVWPPPYKIRTLCDHGVTTTAEVHSASGGRMHYSAGYHFTVGGISYAGSTTAIHEIGDHLKIVYLPEDPNTSMDAKAVSIIPSIIFVTFWGIAFLTGFTFALKAFLRGPDPPDTDEDDPESNPTHESWESNPNDPAWKDDSAVG